MIEKTTPFPERLSRYLRLGNQDRVRREAGLLWEEALELCRISRWKALLARDEFFVVFHPHVQSSKSIQRLVDNAREVWLFAATVGDAIECRSREYWTQREAFRGYVLDRMGSFLVEEQIREMDRLIAEECSRKGLKTTRRFSPGYQDFALEAQAVFVEMASGAMPELKLTSDFLLVPEKSITALKGAR